MPLRSQLPPWRVRSSRQAYSSKLYLRVQWTGPRAAVPLRSDVNTLDGQGLQIRRRILGIEHLAVEEGLLAARGGGRDIGGGNAELLGRVLPEVFAVDLGDQRLGVVTRFVL